MTPSVPVTPVSPVQAAASDYLAAVGHDLAGLPEAERQDILEEVAEHLADVAAELGPEADARALEARLGPAGRYAAELRSAAGYDEAPRAPRARRLVDSVRTFGSSLRQAVEGLRGGPETLTFLRTLRPAWWVLRAWVVAEWLAMGVSNGSAHVVPQFHSNAFVGLVVFVLLAIWSVRVGLRSERLGDAAPWRRTVMVANVAAILLTLPVLGALQRSDNAGFISYQPDPAPSAGIAAVDSNGTVTVATNLFAFGPDGQPIDHVRLYDQDGHPVVVAGADQSDCWAGTTGASPVPTASPSNVFPLPQLTPQLDADGNPTGTCVVSSSAPGFVVPPLAGYTPSATPTPSSSAQVKPSPSVSTSRPKPSAKTSKR
jgi:hypothetical protein